MFLLEINNNRDKTVKHRYIDARILSNGYNLDETVFSVSNLQVI